MTLLTLAIILITVLSAVICHRLAQKKGAKPVFWGWMGLLFGPLAIPFIALRSER